MTKDMIHETLKSGGGITKRKGCDQELIVVVMSAKCSLWDLFLFHMYLMAVIMKVKFVEELIPTEFIEKVIYDGNGRFFLDDKFFEGMKIRTHAPNNFLLKDDDNRGRIGPGIGMDKTNF
jgi:hypothetical protein